MHIRNRKRLVLVLIRGGILVLIAIILQAGRVLSPVESLVYDERVRHCQGYQPAPAAALVHLDVDDSALTYIGHWPWPPGKMARIIDEIARTRPRLLAMDVIFSEADESDPTGERQLAQSFGRLGCALLPVSLNFDPVPPPSRLRRLLLPLLVQDPQRTAAQCVALLRDAGVTEANLDRDPGDPFSAIRQAAFFERIWQECAQSRGGVPDRAALKRKLLPNEDPAFTGSVLGRLFDDEYTQVIRQRQMVRFTLPTSIAGSMPVLAATVNEVPILPLAQATRYSGFADYLRESVEGTVRSVPLLARYHQRIIPHMALAAACAALGVDVHDIRLSDSALTIPRSPAAGGDVVIPVSVRNSTESGCSGAMMEVPLFGRPQQWQSMYDVPDHQRPARHVSVYQVWQICQSIDQLNTDSASLDRLIIDALSITGASAADAYAAAPLQGEAKLQKARDEIAVVTAYPLLFPDPAAVDAETKKRLVSAAQIRADLPRLIEQITRLNAQLEQLRTNLAIQLHGRAIFFGGTATGLMDLQPTSLFAQCPGVVIHGAVFNAILTGKMWRRTSAAMGLWITAAMGLATLALVMLLPPSGAFVGSVLLGGGYLALNGYVLFARENLIVAAAGPIAAVTLVWAGMTLGNYITEVGDRARITRRFRSYVDPTVVDYYVDHPEHVRFDGERRELTIGFSDLAGFTTLTDELGERVVPLLQEYVGAMVPVIRSNQGTMDKQIGDGLCFFFGAPRPDEQHAVHAVKTAMDMHAALAEFNRTLAARGEKPLGMRIGLASGEVIVGDAGPPNASSYTTLGGTTNLASRLEGVNKVFGTRTLISARTAELLGGQYLLRPIANIRVAGKLNCLVVYEPMCLMGEATDRDRRLAECTEEVFLAYRRADFAGCCRAAEELEAAFGASTFARYYRELSMHPPEMDAFCDGEIVLTEK